MSLLTEEQALLRDMAADWVRDRIGPGAWRARHGDDFNYYAEMAEMGWAGIVAAQAHGGVDFGYVGTGLLLEELGRKLAPSPLISTALIGVHALQTWGSVAQQNNWLGRICAGEVVVALALEEGGRHDPGRIAMTATSDGEGWRIDGLKTPVLDGMAADLFIVAARASEGVALFLVEADAVARHPLNRVDERQAAAVRFEGAAASLLGSVTDGAAMLDALLDRGRAGLAAEMLGGAQQAFDDTVEYLKTRVQFGEYIGAFQALQHRVAGLLGELALARASVDAALRAIDADSEDTAKLVSLAKAMAGDTFRKVAYEMVQMHGGIGMTEEHDAGLYLKRARVANATWGDADFHRERYARLTGY